MTLTVVIGSSGSGKTTFLNDTAKNHKCTYIRQYHNVRPYVTVSAIPNFDPSTLPYWKIYQHEGSSKSIKVGGTMAGEFTAGLSGGQRKLLLFELICQRTASQADLLLIFDEPFAGVTDDFVPFITERLNELRKEHNILLVTNDHVGTLSGMADNTITVSAIDRSFVQVNGLIKTQREKAILALSVGDEYTYKGSMADLQFFIDVEILNNGSLIGVIAFGIFSFCLFLVTFWDSDPESGTMVIVAGSVVSFYCLNPYLLSLVDWRNHMGEEADALLHASKSMNKVLKMGVTLMLISAGTLIEWSVVNAVVEGFENKKFWIALLMDSASMTLPFIVLGLYTKLPFQAVHILASLPLMSMVLFSTTFSPGSGVNGLKELRYLFPRFYFWCMIPGVQDLMENCPDDNVLVPYMCLSAVAGVMLFLMYRAISLILRASTKKKAASRKSTLKDNEFVRLQNELYRRREDNHEQSVC